MITTSLLESVTDFAFFRDTFNAQSDIYIPRYVERIDENEDWPSYQKRLRQTPNATDARELTDRILDALQDRMRFVVRYGQLVEWIEGGRGANNCNGTMAQVMQNVAKEIAINGRVGISVEPVRPGRAYCVVVKAEQLTRWEYADADSPSVLSMVEWTTDEGKTQLWIAGGKVYFQVSDGPITPTDWTIIPFLIVEGKSVIAKIAQHQRTLTNLLSIMGTNSSDLVQTFLARQRDSFNNGNHLAGIYEEIEVGRAKGLYYDKGLNQPAFVSQPPGPMTEARQFAAALANDMRRLVGLSGETEGERSERLSAVVGNLGDVLLNAERQVWKHFESFTPSAVHGRTIKYPLSWKAETELDRQKLIQEMYANAQRASGRAGIELATTLVVETQFAGQPSAAIQAAIKAVKAAPCLLNDDTTIVRSFESQAIPTEVACDALGCAPGVSEKALAEAKEKREQQAVAAALVDRTKSADRVVGSVGSDPNAELASKAISQQDPGTTRGEGK